MGSKSSIDLAKSKPTLSDEIIRWALGFGRLLIIIVEIIAFSAFIYRFVLDRELIDLNDDIKAKQAIVESTKEREAQYRNLQERLADINQITTTGNTKITLLNEIIEFTPEVITYDSFIAKEDRLSLIINLTSIPAITEYIDALQENDQITSVIVTGIDNSAGSNAIKIEMEAKLKGDVK